MRVLTKEIKEKIMIKAIGELQRTSNFVLNLHPKQIDIVYNHLVKTWQAGVWNFPEDIN